MISRSFDEHEAGGRRRPARVAVEQRDDDRHVAAADRHHQVHAEQQREPRHGRAALAAPARRLGARSRARASATDATRRSRRVEHVAPRQEQRRAADGAAQLAERDDRAGERDRADEDADVDLDEVRDVDRPLAGLQVACRCRRAPPPRRRSCAGWRPARASTVIGTRAASARRSARRRASAPPRRPSTWSVERGVSPRSSPKQRRRTLTATASTMPTMPEQVASLRALLRRQPAQAEDEEHAGGEVGDRRNR